MTAKTSVAVEDRAVQFICDHVKSVGYPPSVRDIQQFCGFRSSATAKLVLGRLVERGLVTVTPGVARGISVRGVVMVAETETA